MGGVGIGVFPGFCDGFPGMVPGMGGALFVEARFRTRTFAGVRRGYRPALLRPVARCCGGVCLAHAFANVPGLSGLGLYAVSTGTEEEQVNKYFERVALSYPPPHWF